MRNIHGIFRIECQDLVPFSPSILESLVLQHADGQSLVSRPFSVILCTTYHAQLKRYTIRCARNTAFHKPAQLSGTSPHFRQRRALNLQPATFPLLRDAGRETRQNGVPQGRPIVTSLLAVASQGMFVL
jgi:rRNA maturation protein Nop10